MPIKYINYFSNLCERKLISDEYIADLFEYLFSLIKISIHYIHESRGPKLVDDKLTYSNDKFSEIRIISEARIWNVKLSFKKIF